MLSAGFDELDLWGIQIGRVHTAAYFADVLREQGDLPAARAALDRAGMPAVPPPSPQVSWWLTSRLRLELDSGDLEAALAVADDCAERFTGLIDNPAWVPWRSLKAEALRRLDRGDEALDLLDEEVDLARRWGAPSAVGQALRYRGQLRGADGLADLEEAVAVLEDSTARLELAKALCALGTVLRHERRPTDAREPLRRAVEIAAVSGAAPLEALARSELYSTGARPRVTALSGVESLTPSERRIAALAAEGQTNRDIAQALFVTPKTVEVHLGNAYRKLGIRGRRELAGALGA
jgi:DNA-binding CsgD family transcriptional regulator